MHHPKSKHQLNKIQPAPSHAVRSMASETASARAPLVAPQPFQPFCRPANHHSMHHPWGTIRSSMTPWPTPLFVIQEAHSLALIDGAQKRAPVYATDTAACRTASVVFPLKSSCSCASDSCTCHTPSSSLISPLPCTQHTNHTGNQKVKYTPINLRNASYTLHAIVSPELTI